MGSGWVTPPTIVTGLGEIGRAEISSRDQNRRAARMTPLRVVSTFYLETRAATQTVVKQCGT